MALATLSIDLVAKLANLERDMGRAAQIADRNAKKMEAAFSGVGATLRSVASFAAGAFSVSMFSGLIKSAIDAQDNLKDLSKSTSLSVETLAGLGTAATKSGGDLESVAASINKLSVNMGKDAEKFAAIGISAKDPIEAFKQLADVFNAIQDPQERAAFAAEALGKSWQGAAPLLAEGSKSIGEMVEKGTALSKVTAESAAKADELNDKIVDLQTITGSWTTQLTNALVPSLLETANAIDKILVSGSKLETMWSMFRGSIGSQRLSFDPEFASSAKFVEGLQTKLEDLQSKRDSYNPFTPWGDSLEEIDRQILITKNQLEAAVKFKDRLSGPISTDAPLSGSRVSPDVSAFINPKPKQSKSGGGGRSRSVKQSDDLGSLIADLNSSLQPAEQALESFRKAQLDAAVAGADLTDVEKQFYDLINSDDWKTMSEPWRDLVREQFEAADAATRVAEQQQELNDLIAATPTAKYDEAAIKLNLLADAYNAAKISAAQLQEASQAVVATMPNEVKEASDAMSTFAEQAARNMQDAFADFLFDPFDDGAENMLSNFGTALQRMIAEAVAADLASKVFGKAGGGEGDGLLSAGINWLFDALPKFDVGTPYVPFDMPAIIHKGERIVPAAQNNRESMGSGSSNTIIVNVSGTNAPDVRRAAGQGAREALAAINGAGRYR